MLFCCGYSKSAETWLLTLFLPGKGGISPLIVCHVTKSVRNRVKRISVWRAGIALGVTQRQPAFKLIT